MGEFSSFHYKQSPSLSMADHKSPKQTPVKKNTPTKFPKTSTPDKNITPKRHSTTVYVTPTKKIKSSVYEPSPVKSLEVMCKSLKEENMKLKNEVSELFRRLSFAGNDQQFGDLLLENLPLLKLYELFLEVKLPTANKYPEGSSNHIPVVLIPDSSTSDV